VPIRLRSAALTSYAEAVPEDREYRKVGPAMTNYLLAFHGGGMPQTEAEQAKVMKAWDAWYKRLGDATVDPGNPVGKTKTITSDGSVKAARGTKVVSGYTIIKATNLDDAVKLAADCPILSSGGTVEVGETFSMA
jgi:hypothetical protein